MSAIPRGKMIKVESNTDDLTCQQCVQGYYLPVKIWADDNEKWASNGLPEIDFQMCKPCPGSENGTGMAACNFKQGMGSCIYADAIGPRKTEPSLETKDEWRKRMENVGNCSCTTKLADEPKMAATGDQCTEAPPNFYKYNVGRDSYIFSCPRTLELAVSVCEEFSPSYIWEYMSPDGTPRKACTQSCGGKPETMTMCADERISNETFLNNTFIGKWDFIRNTAELFMKNDTTSGEGIYVKDDGVEYKLIVGSRIKYENVESTIDSIEFSNHYINGYREMTMTMGNSDKLYDGTRIKEIYVNSNWITLSDTNSEKDVTVIYDRLTRKGKCFCNGNNQASDPSTMEFHYYRGTSGLCVKSKVKYI